MSCGLSCGLSFGPSCGRTCMPSFGSPQEPLCPVAQRWDWPARMVEPRKDVLFSSAPPWRLSSLATFDRRHGAAPGVEEIQTPYT